MLNIRKRLISLFTASVICMAFVPVYTQAAGLSGWNVSFNNTIGTAELDTTVGYRSNSSMKVVNNSAAEANVYTLVYTNVQVEKGKTYRYGGMVKSDHSTQINACISWGDRDSLLPFTKTFDFTKYEFKYIAPNTDTVALQFIIAGKTNGIWFDDMFFIDEDTGINLIKNSDFEVKEETEEEDTPVYTYMEYEIPGGDLPDKYKEILKSTDFKIYDSDRVSSRFTHLPVYHADITVDGNTDDWSDFTTAHMPMDFAQYQMYYDNENALDLTVDYAFAYDDSYLYMYYDVYDDSHMSYSELINYWMGDSIQLALSEEGESFGYEIGFIHDAKTGQGKILSSNMTSEEIASSQIVTKQENNHTFYEVAIPWTVKYGNKRSSILLDFIVNDNDSGQRRYCVQLAKGIAETKSNAEYPVFEMVPEGQDWYAWIDGARQPQIDVEEEYGLYIINKGELKKFSFVTDGQNHDITVDSGKGLRVPIKKLYDTAGMNTVTAEIECGGKIYSVEHDIEVVKPTPTNAIASELQKEVKAYADEISGLLEKCEKKGIRTDYETMYYMVINQFAKYMSSDISHGDYDRIYYTKESVDKIYLNAKENLEAYLAGTKEPRIVPRYQTSKISYDGTVPYATTFDGEKYEYRPVFFVGYGHFDGMRNELNNFEKWGLNAAQYEYGPQRSMIKGYSFGLTKTGTLDCTSDIQDSVAYSGNKALKITYSTPRKADLYAYSNININVKPETDYELSMWVKGKNVSSAHICTDDWNERNSITADETWKQLKFTFTTSEKQYLRTLKFIFENIIDELYIDDIVCRESGSGEVAYNRDFEDVFPEGEDYLITDSGKSTVIEVLEKANANNVALSLGIGPHYLPSWYTDIYPETKAKGNGFFAFDPNHELTKKPIEEHMRFILPIVKDYPSLATICLTNEPALRSYGMEQYKNDWYKYLEEVHGTIENLNSIYGSSYGDFTEIEIPKGVEDKLPVSYDYKNFNDLMMSSYHKWLADISHEVAPDIPVYAKTMPYVSSFEGSYPRMNFANGTAFEYTADFLDMNGNDGWNFPISSEKEMIKTMWYDFQVGIHEAPVANTEDHLHQDRSDTFEHWMDDYVSADIWQGGIHYRAKSVIWLWERSYDKSADSWGLNLYRPGSLAGCSESALDLMRLSYQVAALQKEKTDIALLYSDASRLYDMTNMPMQYAIYSSLMTLGKKTLFVTENIIDRVNDYDIIVVPKLQYIKDETLDALINYINNGGKLILMGEDCFKYNEYKQPSDESKVNYIYENSAVYENVKCNAEGLDGMTTVELGDILQDYLRKNRYEFVEIIDAKTGERPENMEFTPGICNEKLIVNICNYGDTTDINVVVNGEVVKESVELRAMEKQDENITAEQYKPIMLEIDVDNCFIDTYGHWSEENVSEMYEKGLVTGVSESRFEPEREVTRAEFAAMLVRAAEIRPTLYSGSFSDVDSSAWYANYIQAASDYGFITGRNARPEEIITREEMCDMLVRVYEKRNGHVLDGAKLNFADADSITNKLAVSKATEAGMVHGRDDGNFAPLDGLSRAEAATAVLNYFNL